MSVNIDSIPDRWRLHGLAEAARRGELFMPEVSTTELYLVLQILCGEPRRSYDSQAAARVEAEIIDRKVRQMNRNGLATLRDLLRADVPDVAPTPKEVARHADL